MSSLLASVLTSLHFQESSKLDMSNAGLLCDATTRLPIGRTCQVWRAGLERILLAGGCIPEAYRCWIWPLLACSGSAGLERLPVYGSLVEESQSAWADTEMKEQVSRDLPRTFPLQRTLVNCVGGEAALERVVGAYSVYNKRVGYCQSMNVVAGHLLCCLGLEREEECFWILRHLAETIVPGYWAAPDLPGLFKHTAVLEQLLDTMLPRTAAHLTDVPIVLVVRAIYLQVARHRHRCPIDCAALASC